MDEKRTGAKFNLGEKITFIRNGQRVSGVIAEKPVTVQVDLENGLSTTILESEIITWTAREYFLDCTHGSGAAHPLLAEQTRRSGESTEVYLDRIHGPGSGFQLRKPAREEAFVKEQADNPQTSEVAYRKGFYAGIEYASKNMVPPKAEDS